jgi:hypothetical protein
MLRRIRGPVEQGCASVPQRCALALSKLVLPKSRSRACPRAGASFLDTMLSYDLIPENWIAWS